MAGTPAWIEELPLTAVDTYGVPCVASCVFGWAWTAWLGRIVAVAFAVASHNHGLQACALGDGVEDLGIAFADGLPAEDHLTEALPAGNAVVKEAVHIVGNVVMLPGEYGAGLVGGGGEGIAEDMGEISDWVLSGEGVQRVLVRDLVRPREIATCEAGVGSRGYGVDLVGRWARGYGDWRRAGVHGDGRRFSSAKSAVESRLGSES